MLMAALSATPGDGRGDGAGAGPGCRPSPPLAAARDPSATGRADVVGALDANGNGTLDAGEAARMESLAKVFPAADADANGELSRTKK